MSWNETVKASALVAQAERTANATRIAVDAPWRWNPHDVWLSRAKQPRDLIAQRSMTDPASRPRQDFALYAGLRD